MSLEVKAGLREMINLLGTQGMSDDETEKEVEGVPKPAIPKVVRRRKLRWLSPDVSAVMHDIDSFRPTLQRSSLFDNRGNKPLKREIQHFVLNTQSIPVKSLPKNWYDGDFIRSQTDVEFKNLKVSHGREIPQVPGHLLPQPLL